MRQNWKTIGSMLVFLLLSLSNPLMFASIQRTTPHGSLRNTGSGLNPIQIENRLPGTLAWYLSHPAPYDSTTFDYPAIEGYAWTTSAQAGDEVKFSVSTTASSFIADVYRMGWYQGNGGRLVLAIPSVQGHAYPVPSPDAQTGLVEAHWPVTFTLKPNITWVSGMYMVKLTASNGLQSYIPFVLRSSRASDLALIHAVNTDEAYNTWGGTSLYQDFTKTLKATRAYKVSFDRPFVQDTGAGQFFFWEYPMVRWLEKNGYDVSYLSDVDVQNNPYALQNHRALLIVGHSEYWSKQMSDNLEASINNGVNLGVFAANTLYRQIRYEPRSSNAQPIPERIIVCYKDKSVDPVYGLDNDIVTVQFRSDPVNRPEQSLLGAMYSSYFVGNSFAWVVADASSWVFAGTGLKNMDSLPGLVGYEYDRVYTDYPAPPGLDILSASPVIDILKHHDVSNATLYTAMSGARVFDAGTIQWSWGLDGNSSLGNSHVVSKAAQTITKNILQNFLTAASNSHYPPARNEAQPYFLDLGLASLSTLIIFLVLYLFYRMYELSAGKRITDESKE